MRLLDTNSPSMPPLSSSRLSVAARPPSLDPVVAVHQQRFLELAPRGEEGRLVPGQPAHGGGGFRRPGDEPDPPAALVDQVRV